MNSSNSNNPEDERENNTIQLDLNDSLKGKQNCEIEVNESGDDMDTFSSPEAKRIKLSESGDDNTSSDSSPTDSEGTLVASSDGSDTLVDEPIEHSNTTPEPTANTTHYNPCIASDLQESFADIPLTYREEEPPWFVKDDDIWKMYTEYRENMSMNTTDTASLFLLEESKFDESWLFDQSSHNDVQEVDRLMKILSIKSQKNSKQLPVKKERSKKTVSKIPKAEYSDEFGPDIATTNLLLHVRHSLEEYVKMEAAYAKREERATYIIERRFHVTVEEFLDTVAEGIDRREGINRFEAFLECVEATSIKFSIIEKKKCQTRKNLKLFDSYKKLAKLKHPFKTQHEKDANLKTSLYSALAMHDTTGRKAVFDNRGYASI